MENVIEFFVKNAGVLLFLPLWCLFMIFINSVIPFIASKKLTFNLSLSVNLFNIVFAVFALFYCIHNPQTFLEKNLVWLNNSDLQISLGTLIDNISVSMLLFFSIVIAFIEIYAFGYLKAESNFQKFFIQINFLKFAVLGLIMSSNAVQTFVFSGLVSVGLYFLVNFWFSKKLVSDASKNMFLTNFSGDLFLFTGGIALLYFSIIFSPVKNLVLLSYDNLSFTAETLYSMLSENTFIIVVMIFLSGILIKLAQFPFHSWLSASTEAPAPVNAILQGLFPAVCGGIILLRFYPLFILSKTVLDVVTVFGIISALMFAFASMSQNNIKKLISYITSSQLGLALTAFGLGAYSLCFWLIVVQGIARIVLNLSAGTVIFALNNENDIKYFGGLRKKLPVCAVTFFIGSLALSGLAFGGFYAGGLMFSEAFLSGSNILAISILLALFMGAFALFRAYFLMFEGEDCDIELLSVPRRLNFSVIAFTVITILLGFIGKEIFNFIYFILPDKFVVDMFFAVIQVSVILFALYFAFYLYVSPVRGFVLLKEKLLNKKDIVYKLSYNVFYFDEICKWIVEKIILRFFRLLDFIEKYIVSAFAGLLSLSVRIISYFVSKTRNGNLQCYILYTLLLMVILLLVIMFLYIFGSMLEGQA